MLTLTTRITPCFKTVVAVHLIQKGQVEKNEENVKRKWTLRTLKCGRLEMNTAHSKCKQLVVIILLELRIYTEGQRAPFQTVAEEELEAL